MLTKSVNSRICIGIIVSSVSEYYAFLSACMRVCAGEGGGSVNVRRPSVSLFFCVYVAAVCVLLLLVLLVNERAGDPACLRYRSGEINYVHEYIYKCMFVFATSYAFQ